VPGHSIRPCLGVFGSARLFSSSLEKVKLAFRTDIYLVSPFCHRFPGNFLQDIAVISPSKSVPSSIFDVAEKTHDTPVLRPPRKNRQRVAGSGTINRSLLFNFEKSLHRARIERYTGFKRFFRVSPGWIEMLFIAAEYVGKKQV
jgi:hypothetical protein